MLDDPGELLRLGRADRRREELRPLAHVRRLLPSGAGELEQAGAGCGGSGFLDARPFSTSARAESLP